MEKLKDYVWVAGIILVIGGAYTEWRISVAVDSKFASKGIVSTDKIAAMDGDIEENAADIVRVESKAERIAQILMED